MCLSLGVFLGLGVNLGLGLILGLGLGLGLGVFLGLCLEPSLVLGLENSYGFEKQKAKALLVAQGSLVWVTIWTSVLVLFWDRSCD